MMRKILIALMVCFMTIGVQAQTGSIASKVKKINLLQGSEVDNSGLFKIAISDTITIVTLDDVLKTRVHVLSGKEDKDHTAETWTVECVCKTNNEEITKKKIISLNYNRLKSKSAPTLSDRNYVWKGCLDWAKSIPKLNGLSFIIVSPVD